MFEYIDGVTLKDFINQQLLTRDLAYKFISELCSALQYVHGKQIVHRDLKPINILITHNGNNVKLIDFGLSDCDDFDILKFPAGTRYYLAPEVLEEGHSLDLRADIYSLGVIIGEMAEMLKDKRLADISIKCTQRKPEKRYASTSLVASAVDRAYRHNAKKTILRVVLWACSISAFVLVCSFIVRMEFLGNQSSQFMLPTAPVQNNICISRDCRRILAEKRIALHQHPITTAEELSADSIDLKERLLQSLENDFPLPQQRMSVRPRRLASVSSPCKFFDMAK